MDFVFWSIEKHGEFYKTLGEEGSIGKLQ